MFKGKTAWFSSSVPPSRIQSWKQNDGKEVVLDRAQFVFSDDCQSPDTKKLYESSAYIDEHLAIFHSQYISECVRQGNANDVVLGDYFLPPLEVMKVIRGQKKLAWEKYSEIADDDPYDSQQRHEITQEDMISTEHGSEDNCRTGTTDEVHTSPRRKSPRSPKQKQGKFHIDELPKVTGVLEEFHPGQNGCVVYLKS